MTPVAETDLEKIVARWDHLTDCTLEKALKSAVASWHNLIMEQALPSWPSQVVPLSSFLPGRPGVFLNQLIRNQARKAKRNLSARKSAFQKAQTLLFIKKGSPVPPEEMVKETAVKHRAAMGDRRKGIRVMPGSPADVYNAAAKDALILDTVKGIIREVIPRGWARRTISSQRACNFPSINGHYSSARGSGGAATEVLFNYRNCLQRYCGEELWQIMYHPHIGERELRVDINSASSLMAFQLLNGLKEQANYDVMASFILEPLKVRGVTAGPTVAYWLLKPFQKSLWTSLKSHPTFQLIGTPVTAEVLNNIMGVTDADFDLGGRFFVSGDYTAATDNLRAFLSRETWNFLAEWGGAPNWVRRTGSKSLVGHTIHYSSKLDLEEQKQWNGQLMGSILSFPILCILNAAVCEIGFRAGDDDHLATIGDSEAEAFFQEPVPTQSWADQMNLDDCWGETPDSRRPLSSRPLAVNGDDCVMLYTERQRARWADFANHAGLEPSIGKCYVAPDFLQVNSTGFMLGEDGFVHAPYMNFGLLGTKNSRGGSERVFTDLGMLAREFLKGHSENKQSKLMSIFLEHHRRPNGLLQRAPSGVSWWLPKHLGGLGLPWTKSLEAPYEGIGCGGFALEPEISPKQRMLATMILTSQQPGNKQLRPFPGATADFPSYVQDALRRDNHLMIPVTEDELDDEERNAWCSYSYQFSSSYSSSLWGSLWELPVEEDELTEEPFRVKTALGGKLVSQEHKKSLKQWQKLWDQSSKLKGFAPLPVLLASKPVHYVLPGGLSSVLERERAVPTRILGRISSYLEIEKMGPTLEQMKQAYAC
jgi:hypothetical protein